MLKNYIKIAWRNLFKNKGYTIINIGGLAIGMAIALLIGLWIWDELSFDKNFEKRDHIALVMQNKLNGQKIQTGPWTPYPLADVLRNDYGDSFEHIALSSGTWQHDLQIGKQHHYFTGAFYEPEISEILDLKMLQGVRSGLTDPNSIMISDKVARAIFGRENPMGKTIQLDKTLEVKVTGVYEDIQSSSGFGDLAFIAPWKLYFNHDDWVKSMEDPWRSNAFFIYVQIHKETSMERASQLIRDARLNHVNSNLAKQKPQLFLHPMNKWHLYDAFENGKNVGGRIQYVWMFGIIGCFVLFLACINFINLSTARSEKRAKEVGIRKTIGSLQRQLIYQFFIESFLYVVVAFLFSLLITYLALPLFNNLSNKQMVIPWYTTTFWLLNVLFCVLTTVLSGLYPAFYLSSFKPIKVLKGNSSRSAFIPRKILLVTQFTVSIVLIIGTCIVFRQIQHAKDRPLGYTRDGLVLMNIPNERMHQHIDIIENTLKNSGTFLSISEAEAPPTGINSTSTGFDWEGKDPQLPVEFPNTGISYDYGKTIGWKFVAGRDFSQDFITDSSAVIINEAAAKLIGFEHPVDKAIIWDGQPLHIIGVVKDLLMESPYTQVRPSIFRLLNGQGSVLLAKINPEVSASTALAQLEKVYKTYADDPFYSWFADEDYARKFSNEERVGKLASLFAGLAIFISCLGLLGMAAFMAEKRGKEISVRKILGASGWSIWRMLSIDFIRLVIISFFIAIPLAWYCMHTWLESYVYRTNIPLWIFLVAGLGAIFITLLTISLQTIKAAIANPVDSLRNE